MEFWDRKQHVSFCTWTENNKTRHIIWSAVQVLPITIILGTENDRIRHNGVVYHTSTTNNYHTRNWKQQDQAYNMECCTIQVLPITIILGTENNKIRDTVMECWTIQVLPITIILGHTNCTTMRSGCCNHHHQNWTLLAISLQRMYKITNLPKWGNGIASGIGIFATS